MTRRPSGNRNGVLEEIGFLVSNRIPRRWLTQFMGWFSRIEQPIVRDLSLAAWRRFSSLELQDAKQREFRSIHDCFTRELKDGARTIDPDPAVAVSPCDGIVGSSGRVAGTTVFQAKGYPYQLEVLLGDAHLAARHLNGRYVTLRLTPSMYHRFHAPYDCGVRRVSYLSGDTWNVNPIALKRIERLFCRNERASIELRVRDGHRITLVAVAAILVAGIRLHFLATVTGRAHAGLRVLACDASLRKGEEMGWFQHGSTIIVLAPDGFVLAPGVQEGARLRVGEPLLRFPAVDEAQ